MRTLFFLGSGLAAHALWVLTRPYLAEPDFLARLGSPVAAGSWLVGGWAPVVQAGWLGAALMTSALLAIVVRHRRWAGAVGCAVFLVAAWFAPIPGDARIMPFLAVPAVVAALGGSRSGTADQCDEPVT